ncbi:MAG: carbamoyltransferase HypF, partial [Candidatus Omnitrophota bacterium]
MMDACAMGHDCGHGKGLVADRQRIRVEIRGAVQGVGFRPFIFRLARELGLSGWVRNSPAGVLVEAEGPLPGLTLLRDRIMSDKPALAFIDNIQVSFFDPLNYNDFEIRPSSDEEQRTAMIMPDIATCPACLAEVFDPGNRRYLYPFINCTHCGPRYAIIQRLPYDRVNTSMSVFTMCEACRQEYLNPASRFFHAQPVACPSCGPQVTFWNREGRGLARKQDALAMAVQALRIGQAVAVKGLGGFHLMVAATDEDAVQRLRRRKQRDEKPFAVMFPSLEAVSRACRVSAEELRLLESPMAPIVLLERRANPEGSSGPRIAVAVAPGNPDLGVMLPFTPLHHILLREVGSPLVATSGNISDEPVCIDEGEALARLKDVADCFLIHDRPIVRQVDDSLARVMAGRPLMLRRARGYAPLPVRCGKPGRATLALGGQQKNTVALTVGNNIFVSQHIGDLDTRAALQTFQKTADTLIDLYRAPVEQVAHDRHPDYISTKEAGRRGLPLVPVQHHQAHIVACMVDNDLDEEVLGLAWDGTGYGLDATIWGGEFLVASLTDFVRGGHFRPFPLPGGETAVKEPWRAAWGALWEAMDADMTDIRSLPCFLSRSDQELKDLN